MFNSQLREVLVCINRILNTIETETNSINTELLLLTQNEDAPAVSGSLGIQALGVRNDTVSSLVGANGDYANFQINDVGLLKDATFGQYLATPPTLADTNWHQLTLTNDARLRVDAFISGGVTVNVNLDLADDEVMVGYTPDGGTTRELMKGDSTDGLLVNLGTNNDVDTELPTAILLTDNVATPIAPAVGSYEMLYDGTTWDLARTIEGATTNVGIGASNSIANTSVNTAPLSIRSRTISNSPTSIKASAGNLYGWNLINTSADACYLKFYDTASGSVTVGTTAIVHQVTIPAGVGSNVFLSKDNLAIMNFATAITVAITKLDADNDITAPTSLPIIQIFYK